MQKHILPLVLLLLLTVLVTWPVAGQLTTHVLGHPMSDTYDHLWGSWWYAHSFSQGELPWRSTLSHWPPGGVLFYVDPLGALSASFFQIFLPVAAAYNLSLMVAVLGGLIGGYALGQSVGADRPASLVAAVVFGASPYVLSILHSGVTECLHLLPLALLWVTMERALRGEGRAIVPALCWFWATLGNFYYGAFGGLLWVAALLLEPGQLRVRLKVALQIAGLFLVFAGPVAGLVYWSLHHPDAVVKQENAPGWNYTSLPATDLLTFLRPGDYYFPDNRRTGNFGILHVNYLGWLVVAFAAMGLKALPRLRWPLVLIGVLALGPILCIGGWMSRDPVLPLPASLLYLPGSPFRFVHHPYRMVVLLMLLAAPLVARAVTGKPKVAAMVGGGLLLEFLLLSPASWPISTAPATGPAWYTTAATDPAVTGVLDFPPESRLLNRKWEMYQTLHHKPVPYGVNTFMADGLRDNHFVIALIACMGKPDRLLVSREGGAPDRRWLVKPDPTKLEAGRQALLQHGYSHLVLHTDELAEPEQKCIEKRIGAAQSTDEDLSIYELGALTPIQ